MNIHGRQGDLVIEKLNTKLDGELTVRRDVVFAGDSSGHRHRVIGDVLVQSQTAERTRFRVPEKTLDLTHEKPDGHKTLALEPGDYEIRPLRERGGNGDRPVVD
jgi:hypothetical protein